MAKIIADNVMEFGTVAGLDDVVLTGAVPGFKTFSNVAVDGDTFDYTIAVVNGSMARTGQFESGQGSLNGDGALVRARVDASSSSDEKVVFDAGTKIVMLTYNAASLKGFAEAGNFTASTGSTSLAFPGGYANYVNIVEPITITDIVIDMADACVGANAYPVIYSVIDGSHAGPILAQAGMTADLVAGENVLHLDTPYTAQAGELLWITVFLEDDNGPQVSTMGGDAYTMCAAGVTSPGDPGGTLLVISGGNMRIFGRGKVAAYVAPDAPSDGEAYVRQDGGWVLLSSVLP